MDTNTPKSDGGKEKMVRRNISIELSLWNEARRKTGVFGNLSGTIRKLLYYWLKGEIDLDKYPDIED